jgi:hypothetical protein
MKASLRITVLLAGAAASTALFATCGGGGTGTSGEQTTIDLAGVERGVDLFASAITICHSGSAVRSAPRSDVVAKTMWLARLLKQHRNLNLRADWNPASFFPPSDPGDQFGDCGGRITFPSYSHSSGTTTGTMEFENFCSINEDTGEHNIADGTMSFVDHGTPGAFGPVTNSLEADSPSGLTLTATTSTGTQLSAEKFSFSDFLYDVGVPGGDPTPSNPDRVTLDDATLTNLETSKSYRQTNYSVTAYGTAVGGSVISVSGRSYRSNGSYFDVSTTSALNLNAAGDFTGGQLTFSGANSTNAVLTIVPGSTFQGTLTVNGTPVTNVPACQ